MSSGERPIGAAKGKQSDGEALCQTPPPYPPWNPPPPPVPPPRDPLPPYPRYHALSSLASLARDLPLCTFLARFACSRPAPIHLPRSLHSLERRACVHG